MSREASRSAISGLAIDYSGPLPDLGGYVPLQQEGAIILGTGGDNSNRSSGFFFEGVLTAASPPPRPMTSSRQTSSQPVTIGRASVVITVCKPSRRQAPPCADTRGRRLTPA
jgi:Alpha-L-arabinofuranosidase B, catalytic